MCHISVIPGTNYKSYSESHINYGIDTQTLEGLLPENLSPPPHPRSIHFLTILSLSLSLSLSPSLTITSLFRLSFFLLQKVFIHFSIVFSVCLFLNQISNFSFTSLLSRFSSFLCPFFSLSFSSLLWPSCLTFSCFSLMSLN